MNENPVMYAEEVSLKTREPPITFDWQVLLHYADGSSELATYKIFDWPGSERLLMDIVDCRRVTGHERSVLSMQARAYEPVAHIEATSTRGI